MSEKSEKKAVGGNLKFEEFKKGSKKYRILRENLEAINKVEERVLRRREPSTAELYKLHLLDFWGIVHSELSYKKITKENIFTCIDKFWRWKKEENEKRKKQKQGRGIGRITDKFSKQYTNLITSILTTFFIVNERSDLAELIKAQERQTIRWIPKKFDRDLIDKLRAKETVMKGYNIRGIEKGEEDEFYIARDMLLIELLVSTGVRISEAQNLKIEDVKLESKNPHVLVTRAKGDRQGKSG